MGCELTGNDRNLGGCWRNGTPHQFLSLKCIRNRISKLGYDVSFFFFFFFFFFPLEERQQRRFGREQRRRIKERRKRTIRRRDSGGERERRNRKRQTRKWVGKERNKRMKMTKK
ncbi:hypothetical protein PanWU01x14_145770 [Parasponia andersonii]|uniref:Uncharacterized protein n=1 Tax=Parasponia andersonii TaxID=3476 RepID=A0A2P5CK86_PARAD|nr:hypothetical protein PanWU01x14_145770 [Parasponia andersonii]